jgi:structural maintenance of chromosomes protein 5
LLLSSFDILWYQNAELKATFDEMDDLKKQEKSRQRRILKTKEDLAAAEKELEDLQPYELPKAEMVS